MGGFAPCEVANDVEDDHIVPFREVKFLTCRGECFDQEFDVPYNKLLLLLESSFRKGAREEAAIAGVVLLVRAEDVLDGVLYLNQSVGMNYSLGDERFYFSDCAFGAGDPLGIPACPGGARRCRSTPARLCSSTRQPEVERHCRIRDEVPLE